MSEKVPADLSAHDAAPCCSGSSKRPRDDQKAHRTKRKSHCSQRRRPDCAARRLPLGPSRVRLGAHRGWCSGACEAQLRTRPQTDSSIKPDVLVSALLVACMERQVPCLLRCYECLTQMYLMHHGFVPKVNVRNTINGSTPLHFAAQESERGDQNGRLLCMKMLVAAGAERDIAVHLICPCSSCLYLESVPADSGPRQICRIIAGASRIRCRATLTCAWRWADRRSLRTSPMTKRRRRTSSSSGRTLSAARCSPAPALGGSEQAV